MNKRHLLVVLAYNNEAFISRLLASILEQELRYWSVLINDDKSSDNTVNVIEEFLSENKAKTSEWVLVAREKNIGINQTLYSLTEDSPYDWIKYIAGDDELTPHSLQAYHDALLSVEDDCGVCVSNMHLIDRNSKIIGARESLPAWVFSSSWINQAFMYCCEINAPSVMVKTAVLRRALLDTKARNAEDWPLLRYLVLHKIRVSVIKRYCVRYRIHEDSISFSYSERNSGRRKISDDVRTLLAENMVLATTKTARWGVFLQKASLEARSPFYSSFLYMLKMLNFQHLTFKLILIFWKVGDAEKT